MCNAERVSESSGSLDVIMLLSERKGYRCGALLLNLLFFGNLLVPSNAATVFSVVLSIGDRVETCGATLGGDDGFSPTLGTASVSVLIFWEAL